MCSEAMIVMIEFPLSFIPEGRIGAKDYSLSPDPNHYLRRNQAMAKDQHSPPVEKRNVSQKEIDELANHYAARAVSRATKNEAARQQFILTASLLSVMSKEHPDGLVVEIFILKGTNDNGERLQ
jgi:hypothetical protein